MRASPRVGVDFTSGKQGNSAFTGSPFFLLYGSVKPLSKGRTTNVDYVSQLLILPLEFVSKGLRYYPVEQIARNRKKSSQACQCALAVALTV
jgi:hypothetical protein